LVAKCYSARELARNRDALSLSLLANAGADGEARLESFVECVRVFDQKSPEMSANTKRRHTCALGCHVKARHAALRRRTGDETNMLTATVTTQFLGDVFQHLRIPADAVPVFNTHAVGDKPMRKFSLIPVFSNKQLPDEVVIPGLLEYIVGRLPGMITNGSPSWPRVGFVREHETKKEAV
jgi:hypothetical protein